MRAHKLKENQEIFGVVLFNLPQSEELNIETYVVKSVDKFRVDNKTIQTTYGLDKLMNRVEWNEWIGLFEKSTPGGIAFFHPNKETLVRRFLKLLKSKVAFYKQQTKSLSNQVKQCRQILKPQEIQ